jgi:hypothetical protein
MPQVKPPKIEPMGKPQRISLFDKAERAKQEGIEASYQHAPSIWKQAASDALMALAKSKPEFTTDELWDILAKQGIHTGEPRALGSIMQSAHRSGMIKSTGKYVASYRRHKAPIILWQSNIYSPEA